MSSKTGRIIAAFFIGSAFFISLFTVTPASAATTNWQKGANVDPSYTTEFYSGAFRESLAQLKANNANYVSLVIPLFQSSVTSSELAPGRNTPPDDAIIHAIGVAHSLGLKVNLKPHPEPTTGEWRANIDPADRQEWFASYGSYLKRYASIAQTHGVEQFTIGTELIKLTAHDHHPENTPGWNKLIADVRSSYSGTLTYAANWGTGWADEKNRIAFWDKLDVVGIDAYYPLGNDYNNSSVEYFKSQWQSWYNNDILPFAQKVGKPIIFTEIGYRSTNGAHTKPGESTHNDGVNLTLQANAYEALFQFWQDKSILHGVHIWDWQGDAQAGGNVSSYTPQNKPAQSVMAKWFGQGVSNPDTTSFTGSASVSHNPAARGRQLSIVANFTNTGATVNGATAAVTVIDVNNQQVFQDSFTNQTFNAGESKGFTTNWIPDTNGMYAVTTRIVGANGATLFENNNAAQFSVMDAPASDNRIAFVTGASVPQNPVPLNKPTTVTATIMNSGDGVSSVIVDVELYSPAGVKVAQKVYDNQSFVFYQTREYPLTYTPTVEGNYTVKIGIFSSGWVRNYVWNDKALVFSASNNATTTPPTDPNPNPNPNPGDTTPPVISNGSPTGTLPAGTTEATLRVDTDENASCRFSTLANISYSSMTLAFTSTGSKTHAHHFTGLTPNFNYKFYIRCADGASNANTSDYLVAFNVASSTATTTPPTPPQDAQAPQISITSPTNAQTVSGAVTVSADASDNVGVTGVQFMLDGQMLGAEDTSSPYSITWNTASSTNASHTLAAIARDAAGNRATSTITVTVSNQITPPPPAGCPTTIPNGTFLGCYYDNRDFTNYKLSRNDNAINFDWGGGSPDSSIQSDTYSVLWQGDFTFEAAEYQFNITVDDGVRLYVDNQLILDKWIDQVATYQPKHIFTAGTHAIKVEYFENSGGARAQVGWTKLGSTNPNPNPNPTDTQAPTVSITAPSNGQTVSGTVTVSANASDNVGVAGVRFMLNGQQLGSEDTSSPYLVSWNTTSIVNGTHKLTAIARDAAGNQITSSEITVNVSNQTTPPTTPGTWSSSATASGTTVNNSSTITATFRSATDISNAIVDIEVYNSSGSKVHQQFYSNQSLSQSTAKEYTATWTPTAQGTYIIKLGVFNNNWTTNYHWNGNAGTVSITSQTTPPPPPPADTEKPTTPSNLTASAQSQTQVVLNWNGSTDNVGVTGYKIYRNGSFITNVSNLSFTDSNLQAATTYTYQVSAYDAAGNESDKASVQVTTQENVDTPPPPPPTNPTVTIIWPSDSESFTGPRQFKAAVSSLALSEYTMFWQVDTGGLNSMYDSNEGGPHKEAWIDITHWNWRGNGPYKITFVAKDKNGTTLDQKSVNVYVAR
jgi:hypothetical protein